MTEIICPLISCKFNKNRICQKEYITLYQDYGQISAECRNYEKRDRNMKYRVIYWSRHERIEETKEEIDDWSKGKEGIMVEKIEKIDDDKL